MGKAHAINGFERHRDAGIFAYAFEFIKLDVKEIGSSDAFAKISLGHNKAQGRGNFAEKNPVSPVNYRERYRSGHTLEVTRGIGRSVPLFVSSSAEK